VIDHDLKELDEWSKKLLMSFNPDKTEIMLFSNTDIPEFNSTFNGRTIIISLDFSEKVYILTFEEHSGVCKYLTIYFQYVYSI
jgi:hypothetical protein